MDDQSIPTGAKQQRVIYVFVSSTFRDMHAEHEEAAVRQHAKIASRSLMSRWNLKP